LRFCWSERWEGLLQSMDHRLLKKIVVGSLEET
jgi:hypothetical protein